MSFWVVHWPQFQTDRISWVLSRGTAPSWENNTGISTESYYSDYWYVLPYKRWMKLGFSHELLNQHIRYFVLFHSRGDALKKERLASTFTSNACIDNSTNKQETQYNISTRRYVGQLFYAYDLECFLWSWSALILSDYTYSALLCKHV